MTEDAFGIVGSVIAGTYSVVEVVAEGGFGVLYRAQHGGLRAPVAMKLLKVPPQNAEQRAKFLELFRAEAELLCSLSASLPTIVRPLHVDAFEAADGRFVPYVVTGWLEGVTLAALIKARNREGKTAVPLRKLVRLLTPVARTLEHALDFRGPEGAISIVHGDLKPQKIFLARVAGEELVKILDFGVSKVRRVANQVAGPSSQDSNASTAFTPAYGAPEHWAPRHYGETGPWTDVWGLALCIVETLATRPIIDGDRATMRSITLDATRRPTPRSAGVAVSDEVEAVFASALALDPRARPRDVGVFWNELSAALQVTEAKRARALPGDARAEDSSSARVELVELPSRMPVGSRAAAVRPAAVGAEDPEIDLEFDPISATRSQRSADAAPVSAFGASGHFVPDLELAPALVRRPSGARPMARATPPEPSMLDLDDGPGAALALDLDLPSHEPIARRTLSSSRLAAAHIPAQHESTPPARGAAGSLAAIRDSIAPDSVALAPGQPRVPLLSPTALSPAALLPAAFDAAYGARVSGKGERRLVRRLRIAFVLFAAAIAVAMLDPLYAAATGEVLKVIGLRLSWFGGALLLLALVLGVRETLRAT